MGPASRSFATFVHSRGLPLPWSLSGNPFAGTFGRRTSSYGGCLTANLITLHWSVIRFAPCGRLLATPRHGSLVPLVRRSELAYAQSSQTCSYSASLREHAVKRQTQCGRDVRITNGDASAQLALAVAAVVQAFGGLTRCRAVAATQ